MALPRTSPIQFRLNSFDVNVKFRRAAVNHDTDRPAVRFAPCCNPKEMTKGISHCVPFRLCQNLPDEIGP